MAKSKKTASDKQASTASGKDKKTTPAAAEASAEDALWAEAMAEQTNIAEAESPSKTDIDVFQPLEQNDQSGQPRDLEMIMDIPVHLSVELGRTRLTIKQLLELTQGSVLELDGLPGEPMDILINDYPVAKGEVVVVDDKYGIRVTEIMSPSERLQRLNP